MQMWNSWLVIKQTNFCNQSFIVGGHQRSREAEFSCWLCYRRENIYCGPFLSPDWWNYDRMVVWWGAFAQQANSREIIDRRLAIIFSSHLGSNLCNFEEGGNLPLLIASMSVAKSAAWTNFTVSVWTALFSSLDKIMLVCFDKNVPTARLVHPTAPINVPNEEIRVIGPPGLNGNCIQRIRCNCRSLGPWHECLCKHSRWPFLRCSTLLLCYRALRFSQTFLVAVRSWLIDRPE